MSGPQNAGKPITQAELEAELEEYLRDPEKHFADPEHPGVGKLFADPGDEVGLRMLSGGDLLYQFLRGEPDDEED